MLLEKRIARAERYHELLAHLPVHRSDNWRSSRTLWRYTLLLETPADALQVTAQLRGNKIHASNHYWSLADLFSGDKSLPNTRYFCPRVLNLWVDDVADDAYIARSCDIVESTLHNHVEIGS
jgi:dTDP-4-amino-4,6-dideoxygalactose transaminase